MVSAGMDDERNKVHDRYGRHAHGDHVAWNEVVDRRGDTTGMRARQVIVKPVPARVSPSSCEGTTVWKRIDSGGTMCVD